MTRGTRIYKAGRALSARSAHPTGCAGSARESASSRRRAAPPTVGRTVGGNRRPRRIPRTRRAAHHRLPRQHVTVCRARHGRDLRDGYAVLRALLPPGRRNVRDDALDPRFLAIVREHGVLAAVTRSAPTTVPRSTTASAGGECGRRHVVAQVVGGSRSNPDAEIPAAIFVARVPALLEREAPIGCKRAVSQQLARRRNGAAHLIAQQTLGGESLVPMYTPGPRRQPHLADHRYQ
jgi:hypothetical protein